MPIPDAAALEAGLPEGVTRAELEAEARAKAEQYAAELPAELSTQLSTPAGVAEALVEALESQSTVSSSDDVRVGGRDAYELRVEPDTDDSLVESVSLAVDAESGLPLRVVVSAVGQDAPAFSITVDELDLSTPDAAVFSFTPPPSATVTEIPEFDPASARPDAAERPETDDAPSGDGVPAPAVLQKGWATIVEIPGAGDAEADPAADAMGPLLDAIATPVDGGAVVRTALVTVFLADDGRILAGTVPLSALQAAAAR